MKQRKNQPQNCSTTVLPPYIQYKTETIASKMCSQENKYSMIRLANFL